MTRMPELQLARVTSTCSHFCVSMVRSNSCPYKPIWVRKPVLNPNTTCFNLTDLKELSRPATVMFSTNRLTEATLPSCFSSCRCNFDFVNPFEGRSDTPFKLWTCYPLSCEKPSRSTSDDAEVQRGASFSHAAGKACVVGVS